MGWALQLECTGQRSRSQRLTPVCYVDQPLTVGRAVLCCWHHAATHPTRNPSTALEIGELTSYDSHSRRPHNQAVSIRRDELQG